MWNKIKICGICLLLIAFSYGVMAKNYLAIDRHAQRAPELSSEAGLRSLARHLTGPYRSDEDKARAIYAWIVYHIDYDDYKFRVFLNNEQRNRNRTVPEIGSIIETRVGICGDIAPLFVQMARYANLEAEVIPGIAVSSGVVTRRTANEFKHVWVAVKINGEWEFVDPTWALGDARVFANITNDAAYRREMRARKKDALVRKARTDRTVSNRWFLTDKDEMIKTHFPDDERWQLQRHKISRDKFLRNTQ